MEPVKRSIMVDAAPGRVLDVLSDFESYPEWQKEVVAARVLDRDEAARPSHVEMTMVAMGIKSNLEIKVHYPESGLSWNLVSGSLLTRSDTVYSLRENPSGHTEVDLEMANELKMKVPASMLKIFISKGIDDTLAAVKERAESGGSPGSASGVTTA